MHVICIEFQLRNKLSTIKSPFTYQFVLPIMVTPKQTVQGILTELPTLLAVAVVETETGMPLASHTNIADFDIETAAAYNTEVVKAKLKAIQALKLNQTVQDILLTLTDQLHLLKLSADGQKFIYLAVNSKDTNLAQARQIMKAHSASLN
jgi:predicted regulator of Ras-like GTPase activity (Roadblock/LC7/MglB family)